MVKFKVFSSLPYNLSMSSKTHHISTALSKQMFGKIAGLICIPEEA
jgi:hypothetical protein